MSRLIPFPTDFLSERQRDGRGEGSPRHHWLAPWMPVLAQGYGGQAGSQEATPGPPQGWVGARGRAGGEPKCCDVRQGCSQSTSSPPGQIPTPQTFWSALLLVCNGHSYVNRKKQYPGSLKLCWTGILVLESSLWQLGTWRTCWLLLALEWKGWRKVPILL